MLKQFKDFYLQKEGVIEPKQEDLDYLDKQFTDIHGCR